MVFITDSIPDPDKESFAKYLQLGERVVETPYGGPIRYEVAVDAKAGAIIVRNTVTGLCHRADANTVVNDALLYEKGGILFRNNDAGKLREAKGAFRDEKGRKVTIKI